jgi:hypothetical protein
MEAQEAKEAREVPVEASPTVGDLIAEVYPQFLEVYGDAERAALETANIINTMLADARAGAAAS